MFHNHIKKFTKIKPDKIVARKSNLAVKASRKNQREGTPLTTTAAR